MRPALLILPLLALTACATPREQCINEASREARVLSALVNETRANLARGYALEERQEVRSFTRMCRGENSDGTTFRFPCSKTDTITVTEPVAIDLNAETAKLASLEERLAQVQTVTNAAVAQCIAIHPE